MGQDLSGQDTDFTQDEIAHALPSGVSGFLKDRSQVLRPQKPAVKRGVLKPAQEFTPTLSDDGTMGGAFECPE